MCAGVPSHLPLANSCHAFRLDYSRIMGTSLFTFDSCITIIQSSSRPYASSIISFKRTPRNYKTSSSGLAKIMFPVPASRAASDVPPYTPTDLTSPTVVSAPPYTEIATQDPADSNETATGDPAVANLTPKSRHRRRETCPLSSHPWVLWLLWLYCSALFSVEIVELIRLLPLFYLQYDFVFGGRHCAR